MDPDLSPWKPIKGETPIDPSGLKGALRDTVKTRAELNVVEAENIRKPTVKYLAGWPTRKMAPFDYSWLLRLHREMFCDVWEWAGQPRTVGLNIGVAWQQVQPQLMALPKDLEQWQRHKTPLIEQAALLHHRAVWIHPFHNGNGRWARMLANIWLRLHKAALVRWPDQNIEAMSPIRDEYLATLRAADTGDMEPLFDLHRRYWEEE